MATLVPWLSHLRSCTSIFSHLPLFKKWLCSNLGCLPMVEISYPHHKRKVRAFLLKDFKNNGLVPKPAKPCFGERSAVMVHLYT